MKKIAVLILSVLMAVALCACGGSSEKPEGSGVVVNGSGAESGAEFDETAIKENFDKATALIESAIDTTGITKDVGEEDNSFLYACWYTDAVATPATFPMEVELDGNKVVIGETTEKEVEALDLDIDKQADMVEPDEIMSLTVSKGGKSSFLTLQTNETGKAVPISDLLVYGFTCGDKDFTVPYNYGGITPDSSLEDVLAAFGVPNDSINLNSDELGATFTLAYFNEANENGQTVSTMLEIDFQYDANSDTASLYGVNLSLDKYTKE